MKTTLDISDPLLRQAKDKARREGTTLRALVERGLRQIIAESGETKPFRLRDASVDGKGLAPEFAEGGWERIRDEIYRGRGT